MSEGITTSWHSYPKVYALGHAALANLLEHWVVIEEKIDGSQFSFGVFDGQIRMKSRSKDQTDEVDSLFERAAITVESIKNKLKPGWTYRAEYLQKPKHNTIPYNRIPKNHLIIFDINSGHEKYLSYKLKKLEAERIGLECVPLLDCGYGENFTVDDVRSFLNRDSILGGSKIEGIVVKNYHQYGADGKVLMGKYVSEAFKEKHKKEWNKSNPGDKNIRQLIGEEYRHEGRWRKAIQHIKERGELTNSPKDIGGLIKEVQNDVAEECAEEIKNKLYNWAFEHIRRTVVSGLPEWYKQLLMEQQSENERI